MMIDDVDDGGNGSKFNTSDSWHLSFFSNGSTALSWALASYFSF
jgi:hypothetical protein